jgi:hypothetical protein
MTNALYASGAGSPKGHISILTVTLPGRDPLSQDY